MCFEPSREATQPLLCAIGHRFHVLSFQAPYWLLAPLHDHGKSGSWRRFSTLDPLSLAMPWISLFLLLASSTLLLLLFPPGPFPAASLMLAHQDKLDDLVGGCVWTPRPSAFCASAFPRTLLPGWKECLLSQWPSM